MWSNIKYRNVQLERCDQIQIKSTRNRWSNTDKGQLGRCDQIQIKVN